MEIQTTVHDLLRLIGQLYVENALLREQLQAAQQEPPAPAPNGHAPAPVPVAMH